jgi:hypothetical protein
LLFATFLSDIKPLPNTAPPEMPLSETRYIKLDVLDSPTEKSARGLRSRGGSDVTLPPELFWDKICEPLSYGTAVRESLSFWYVGYLRGDN